MKQITARITPFLLLAVFISEILWNFGFLQLRLIINVIATLLLFFFYILYNTKNKKIKSSKILVIYMVFLGIIQNFNHSQFPVNFLIDIGTLGLIFSVLLISRMFANQGVLTLKILILISLLFFIYSFPKMDLTIFNIDQESARDAAFQYPNINSNFSFNSTRVIYNTQNVIVNIMLMSMLVMPLIYKSKNKGVFLFFIFFSIFLTLLFSFYYQKRQAFVELIIIILTITLLYNKINLDFIPKSKFVNIIILIFALFVLVNSNFSSNLFNRISDEIRVEGKFDRFNEAQYFLNYSSIPKLIFGYGFGGFIPNTPGGTVMHIGYVNLVFKGGVILLLLFVFAVLDNIITCYKSLNKSKLYTVGIFCSIFLLTQMSFSPAYSWNLSAMFMGFGLFSKTVIDNVLVFRNRK